MKKIRTAIILCGGKGTRLGLLGKKIPKTMVKIHGREILWYIINTLKKNNFNHLILPLGYKGNKIRNFFKKNKKIFDKVDLVDTGLNSNIGKRISLVLKKIKSENFLLLNGDAIFDFNLEKKFSDHLYKNKDITFISGEITYPYGTIGMIGSKVIDFKRNLVYESLKTRTRKSYIAYNYTGMSIIKTSILKKHKNKFKRSSNFEKDLFPIFVKKYNTCLIKLDGFWHSIDNVKDIEAINDKKSSGEKYNKLSKLKKNFL